MNLRHCTEVEDHRIRHRILVLDDHPSAPETICKFLQLRGHEARPASTGHEALDDATLFQPTIALIDLVLPDLSGYDVARELPQRVLRPPYLAALTGRGTVEDRARAFAAGFDEYVLKPVDAATIDDIIRCADRNRSAVTATTGSHVSSLIRGEPTRDPGVPGRWLRETDAGRRRPEP